ncbi:MAG: FG-GAP repeat protein, partial [Gemmatimonadetes bacterium]|nr:FG-GAP repeat protein [Gemmatimonadota bacterium]
MVNLRFSGVLALGLGLVAAPALQAQGFGASLALGDDAVFVGEGLNVREPGYVYVFARNAQGAWERTQKLEASDAEPNDHFGRSLAYAGGSLLVGTTVRNESTGAVYVFERDASGQWSERAILTAPDGAAGDALGRVMATDGQTVLASTWAHQDSRGAVYVYERDGSGTWTQTAKLMGSDIGPEGLFGMSLAVNGDRILVGAPTQGDNTGVVYAFHRENGTWSETGKLQPAAVGPNSRFGTGVALRDGEALIGAQTHNQFRGTAFRFTLDEATGQWSEAEAVPPFDGGDPGLQYGVTVAYNG